MNLFQAARLPEPDCSIQVARAWAQVLQADDPLAELDSQIASEFPSLKRAKNESEVHLFANHRRFDVGIVEQDLRVSENH
jgi:hypothetical protein